MGRRGAMRKKIILFSLLVLGSVLLGVADFLYPDPLLEKAIYTFAALGTTYLMFEIILEEAVLKKIKV